MATQSAAVVVKMASSGSSSLLDGYNSFIALLPPGLLTAMAIFGVGLFLWVTGRWLWKHRHGSQGGVAKGAPVLGWLIALALAAPAWIIPVFIIVFGGLVNILINVFSQIGTSIGG
ncbi:hypothetical protein [Microbacterium enclense]|uniref:hypothetical protein n=1 Tax=Microbacterium enclense TaxID=993073 RepID=UPI003F7E86CB